MREIRALQKKVNRDSVDVAEKYLRINVTGREHRVSQILAERLRAGNLSAHVVDEVNEFALLQKVYIIMRLRIILGLTESDFDPNLIASVPESYRQLMFGGDGDDGAEAGRRPRYVAIMEGLKSGSRVRSLGGLTKREATSAAEEEEEGEHRRLDDRALQNIAFFLYHR